MALEDISVVSAPDRDQLTGNATAVLHEVAELLVALAGRGESGVIDLNGMPLSIADKEWLRAKLGKGEVEMALSLEGASQVHETAFHGVWWLVHYNQSGVLTGEFIEVNRVPALALAHPEDISEAADRLALLIDDL